MLKRSWFCIEVSISVHRQLQKRKINYFTNDSTQVTDLSPERVQRTEESALATPTRFSPFFAHLRETAQYGLVFDLPIVRKAIKSAAVNPCNDDYVIDSTRKIFDPIGHLLL